MDKNFDELKVVAGCAENDRACQEKLYRRFFPNMQLMVMRYTQDEDQQVNILNDGFLKVFKKIHTFEHRGSLEGWIRRIVYHSLADYFKKENRYLKFMVFEEKDDNVNEHALENLYAKDLLALVSDLPKASREVFRLYAIDGFPHKEIAKQLGISEGTSKWHLSNSRKILKEMIFSQNRSQEYAG